jgi:hypothetical protein
MGDLRTLRRARNHPQNCKGSTNKKFIYYRVLLVLLWDCLFWLGLPYIPRFWPHIYAISTEIFMKNSSIWYSTCSCPGDLPNEREISDSFICEQFSIKTPSQNCHTKSPENSWKCRLLNFGLRKLRRYGIGNSTRKSVPCWYYTLPGNGIIIHFLKGFGGW